MKNIYKGFLIGVLSTSIILSTSLVFGNTISKNIEVVFNKVKLEVNGQPVKVENILYNGTTYIPIRAVAEMLDKNVEWNETTNTASINNKTYKTTNISDNIYSIKDIMSITVDSKDYSCFFIKEQMPAYLKKIADTIEQAGGELSFFALSKNNDRGLRITTEIGDEKYTAESYCEAIQLANIAEIGEYSQPKNIKYGNVDGVKWEYSLKDDSTKFVEFIVVKDNYNFRITMWSDKKDYEVLKNEFNKIMGSLQLK